MNAQSRFAIVVLDGLFLCRSRKQRKRPGDSRNKTRPAKVVVVANSKQKVFSWTHNVVKYTPKNFGFDYTLYWQEAWIRVLERRRLITNSPSRVQDQGVVRIIVPLTRGH